MRTIWKYPVYIQRHQEIRMPRGAILLTIRMQGGTPMLWAWVDDGEPQEPRKIAMYGTGWDDVEGSRYIASIQTEALVWHFFEV